MRLSRHASCYSCYDDSREYDLEYNRHDRQGHPDGFERRPSKKRARRTAIKIVETVPLRKIRINLGILSVCRQAYIETNHFLWGTTVWSFTNSLAFGKFLANRSAIQRRHMRKIHLDLDPRYGWISQTLWGYWWTEALRKSPLTRFAALEVVHLDIMEHLRQECANFPMLADLRHVAPKTVTVNWNHAWKGEPNFRSLTLLERWKKADELQEELLSPIEPEKQPKTG